MYQRYYRQRKFGKIFSVFLVIGSGMTNYLREGKNAFKNIFCFENFLKYQEYLPNNIKDLIDEMKNIKTNTLNKNFEDRDLFSNKKKIREDFNNEFLIYRSNLDILNRNFNNNLKKLNFEILKNQIQKNEEHDNKHKYNKFLFQFNNCLKFQDEIFKKDFSIDLKYEDRRLIESYFILKKLERKLL